MDVHWETLPRSVKKKPERFPYHLVASTQNWSFEFITEKNLKTREYGAKLKRIKKKITRLTERETFRELARHCQEHGLRLPNASCTELSLYYLWKPF